jgi:transcriptional regulator with PAS, ATPase and Fis domain
MPTEPPELLSPVADELAALVATPAFGPFLDALSDGVLVFDGAQCLLALNQAARQLTGLDDSALGEPLEVCFSRSAIDWPVRTERDPATRRRDYLVMAEAGRPVLAAERPCRIGAGIRAGHIILLRDLRVLDHTRRSLTGDREAKVFKFLSDRASTPDFETQRRLAPAIDTALLHGERALRQGARVLLVGESGSGKTELARHLHRAAGMPGEAFVHVNCGAIPESLFESEMFGYERGAFTGALASGNRGLIEAADGGTLFLDEVGEIPLTLQAKLLKFLEDGLVQRVGARSERRIDVRIVAATNRDLGELVSNGQFRQDLYYRLAVFVLDIPPLRAQPGLKAHLIDHFLSAANRVRTPKLRLSPACRAALLAYSFPGNIRELHNLVQHLSIVAGHTAEPTDIPAALMSAPSSRDAIADGDLDAEASPNASLRERVRDYERLLIEAAILRHGSKRAAARALGIDIGTVVRKTR